ncbi:MAG: hypothetical protein EAZ14_01855, partial [Runella slithyformis]
RILLNLKNADGGRGYDFLLKRTPIEIFPNNGEDTMTFVEKSNPWIGHIIRLCDDYFLVKKKTKRGSFSKPVRYEYSDLKLS